MSSLFLKKLEESTLNKIIIYGFFILIFISKSFTAIGSDKNEPIYLESDSAKWDEESQKSTYRGNVVVTQGSMLLTGNLLVVTSQNNEIKKMIVNGEKATYKQKTKNGKIVNGAAKQIEYYVDSSRVIFINDAVLTQSNNTVKSNKIIYMTNSENIIAGDKKGKSRVKMTLEPSKNDE